jgi:6-pyruvoyltetrahydropterin/6-carboxytetrahydropterin synthase
MVVEKIKAYNILILIKKIMYQTITRKGSFDSGHRVMNERMKCFNVHGHTYLYELTYSFDESKSIGYAIDFKEIKRVACQWIDDILDHGMILNPEDKDLIDVTKKLGSKLWLMSLNGEGKYCNPTAENISKEIFMAMDMLFHSYKHLKIDQIRLYETPNCYTDCCSTSINYNERENFVASRGADILKYAEDKGIVEYDDRIITR